MSDEPEPEGSRLAGAMVLTVAAGGVGLAIYTYSRDALVLLVWVLGAAALWWVARTPNRTPPAPSERGSEEKPQFSIVQDPDHINRWSVTEKETGT